MPEVAARAHLRWIVPVLDAALADAGAGWPDIDGIAVTYGPGLAGSLLVGINFAKALAWVHDQPLIGVNHLEGHVYAAWLADPGTDPAEPVFPLVALVVSGGHTFLVAMRDHLHVPAPRHDGRRRGRRGVRQGRPAARARLPGRAGDPARGGRGDAARRRLSPRLARRHLRLQLQRPQDGRPADRRCGAGRGGPAARRPRRAVLSDATVAELAYGFQASVVDVLVTKTMRAAEATGARSIVLGGGVAANSALRERLAAEAARCGLPLVVPRPGLCTDNGAMIGAAGARRFAAGERSGLDLDARPSLPLARR